MGSGCGQSLRAMADDSGRDRASGNSGERGGVTLSGSFRVGIDGCGWRERTVHTAVDMNWVQSQSQEVVHPIKAFYSILIWLCLEVKNGQASNGQMEDDFGTQTETRSSNEHPLSTLSGHGT